MNISTYSLIYDKTHFAEAGIPDSPPACKELRETAIKLTDPANARWAPGLSGGDVESLAVTLAAFSLQDGISPTSAIEQEN